MSDSKRVFELETKLKIQEMNYQRLLEALQFAQNKMIRSMMSDYELTGLDISYIDLTIRQAEELKVIL